MNACLARRGLAALLAISLLPLAALAQSARAERPTYTVGDEWALKDATYRLARIEKNVYIFTADGDREIRLTRDLGVTFVRRGADCGSTDEHKGREGHKGYKGHEGTAIQCIAF